MDTHRYDFLFKFILIGYRNVGKTCLMIRYTDDTWINDLLLNTVGIDFKIKMIEIDSKKVKMQIWDGGNYEINEKFLNSYIKGMNGILFIYDITNRRTFERLEGCLIETEKIANENVLKMLIGNKCDLEERREITTKEGIDFANKYGMKFFETSARNNINVSEIFQLFVTLLFENCKENKNSFSKKEKNINISSTKNLKTKKGCH